MQVPIAQGATDVAFYQANGICIRDAGVAKAFADTEKLKAETKKIEAQKKVCSENTAQRKHDMQKLEKEQQHEVEMKDVRKLELEVELAKIKGQAPTAATTNASVVPAAKRKKKAAVVPAAIVKKTKSRKPLTREQMDNNNKKKREKREKHALGKTAKDNLPTSPKAAA